MTKKHRFNTILPLAAAAMATVVLTTASAHAELVVHYKLDETSGTVASDATVNGNDGTVVSPTWEVDTTGLTDPTSTTGVSMPSPNLLSGVTGLAPADDTFTIMFWLQSDDFVDDTFARFFSIGNDVSSQSEAIFAFVLETEFDEDQVEVVYYPLVQDSGGESTVFTIEPNPLTTVWHHHAAVVDGLDLSYYIDGTLRNSGTMAGALTNSEFYILGSPTQSSNRVSGSIDEVGVFDTVLTESEISGFMTNGLEGTPSAADPEIADVRHLGTTVELDLEGLDSTKFYQLYRDITLPLGGSKVPIGGVINGPTTTTVTDTSSLPVDAYYQVEEQPAP